MSATERDWQEFHKRMRDVDTAPLKDRNEAAAEWLKAMRYTPALIAERVGWLFNGSYGHAEYDRAWSILNAGKRANRVAQLGQLIAALEWQVPARMAAAAWNKLDASERTKVNDAILAEIREWERNPEYAHMRKNPARRTVIDPITRKRVRVKSGKMLAGGGPPPPPHPLPFRLFRDGKIVHRFATEIAALKWLQQQHSYSWSHAFEHEGYRLTGPDGYDSNTYYGKNSPYRMKKNPQRLPRPVSINDTEIHTWFERDRRHVELRDKHTDKTLMEWWDDDVSQAVQDGFLDPRDYHRSAWDYYQQMNPPRMKKNPATRHKWLVVEGSAYPNIRAHFARKNVAENYAKDARRFSVRTIKVVDRDEYEKERGMKTNPHTRGSKRKLSPKQAAWRKEFARRVKAGMFKRGKKTRGSKYARNHEVTVNPVRVKKNPNRKLRRKAMRNIKALRKQGVYTSKSGVRLIRRMTRNPARSAVVLRCELNPSLARKYYYDENKPWWLHTTGQCLTDEKRYAKRFTSDRDALRYATEIKRGLVGTGVTKVVTERA